MKIITILFILLLTSCSKTDTIIILSKDKTNKVEVSDDNLYPIYKSNVMVNNKVVVWELCNKWSYTIHADEVDIYDTVSITRYLFIPFLNKVVHKYKGE